MSNRVDITLTPQGAGWLAVGFQDGRKIASTFSRHRDVAERIIKSKCRCRATYGELANLEFVTQTKNELRYR